MTTSSTDTKTAKKDTIKKDNTKETMKEEKDDSSRPLFVIDRGDDDVGVEVALD
jgi:hypothetical protein